MQLSIQEFERLKEMCHIPNSGSIDIVDDKESIIFRVDTYGTSDRVKTPFMYNNEVYFNLGVYAIKNSKKKLWVVKK